MDCCRALVACQYRWSSHKSKARIWKTNNSGAELRRGPASVLPGLFPLWQRRRRAADDSGSGSCRDLQGGVPQPGVVALHAVSAARLQRLTGRGKEICERRVTMNCRARRQSRDGGGAVVVIECRVSGHALSARREEHNECEDCHHRGGPQTFSSVPACGGHQMSERGVHKYPTRGGCEMCPTLPPLGV